jgi:uncharacterized protein YqhQ
MSDLKLPTYGGQAVIEGVMMRGRNTAAIAMRAPDHQIVVRQEKLSGIYQSRIAKIPFLRGLIMLWDALGLGIQAITISANLQNDENEKIEGPALYITLAISIVFAVGLFFLTPAAIGHLAENYLVPAITAPLPAAQAGSTVEGAPTTQQPANHSSEWAAWWGNLAEGFVRLLILVGYIWLIGKVPDIQRVFGYHGAEHKTINAFESGAELSPESVARFSLEHPRCGTAFLLTLVLVSIVVFALLGPMPVVPRFISRVVFIPVLAGIAYEYIRWTSEHLDSPIVKILVKPNLALQHLTTREPNLEMLEVSIAAFNAMRSGEVEISL